MNDDRPNPYDLDQVGGITFGAQPKRVERRIVIEPEELAALRAENARLKAEAETRARSSALADTANDQRAEWREAALAVSQRETGNLCETCGQPLEPPWAAEKAHMMARITTLEAKIAAIKDGRASTHSDACWRWHLKCAVAKIEDLQRRVVAEDNGKDPT